MISAKLPRMSLLYRIWILGAGWLLLAGGLWAVDWVRLPGLTAFETQSDVPLLGGDDPTAMTWHPVGRPNMLWEFTDRLVLQTSIPELIARAEADVRLKGGKRVEADIIVFQAMDARTAMEIAGEFSGLPGVDAVYPVFRRPMELNSAYAPPPEDAFFPAHVNNVDGQWYLENRNPTNAVREGIDVNARAAWPWSRGKGITVAVVDVGVELEHPELRERMTGAPHHNFAENTDNGLPFGTGKSDAHGTGVAGLIGATAGDDQVMAGVAPEVQMASWVIYNQRGKMATDEQLGTLYSYLFNSVAVQNHSFSPNESVLLGPSLLEQAGMQRAYLDGRHGLGVVMVHPAGNNRELGQNANEDGYANDFRSITVAAALRSGATAPYSEPGACVLVAAPGGKSGEGGLFTTDLIGAAGGNFLSFYPPYEYLSDYRFDGLGFIGTSAAASLVSGVVALMLSANPGLSVRDVQWVLALSASYRGQDDPSACPNGAGLRVSHNLGFGLLDAGEAVRLALRWSNRPPAEWATIPNLSRVAIPDNGLQVELLKGGAGTFFDCLPGQGPFPDELGTQAGDRFSIVDFGLATNRTEIPSGIEGPVVALVERGRNNYSDKIANLPKNVALVIFYNYEDSGLSGCPGGDQLCIPGGTDFSPYPVVFVGRTAGLELKQAAGVGSSAKAGLRLQPADLRFEVVDPLSIEHVTLQLQSDHSVRGDLRVALRSPAGTVSVLQRYNADTSAGPLDWTYMSTHHYLEPSVGTWTLEILDQATGGQGAVLQATLNIQGVRILDSDRDGLDDNWERQQTGGLSRKPSDPTGDGRSTVGRDYAAGGSIQPSGQLVKLDVTLWYSDFVRISWPFSTNRMVLYGGEGLDLLKPLDEVPDIVGPDTSAFLPATNAPQGFYQLRMKAP